jgi:hypothetical protein
MVPRRRRNKQAAGSGVPVPSLRDVKDGESCHRLFYCDPHTHFGYIGIRINRLQLNLAGALQEKGAVIPEALGGA